MDSQKYSCFFYAEKSGGNLRGKPGTSVAKVHKIYGNMFHLDAVSLMEHEKLVREESVWILVLQ